MLKRGAKPKQQVVFDIDLTEGLPFEETFEELVEALATNVDELFRAQQAGFLKESEYDQSTELVPKTAKEDIIALLLELFEVRGTAIANELNPALEVIMHNRRETFSDEVMAGMLLSTVNPICEFWHSQTQSMPKQTNAQRSKLFDSIMQRLRFTLSLCYFLPNKIKGEMKCYEQFHDLIQSIYKDIMTVSINLGDYLLKGSFSDDYRVHLAHIHELFLIEKLMCPLLHRLVKHKSLEESQKEALWDTLVYSVQLQLNLAEIYYQTCQMDRASAHFQMSKERYGQWYKLYEEVYASLQGYEEKCESRKVLLLEEAEAISTKISEQGQNKSIHALKRLYDACLWMNAETISDAFKEQLPRLKRGNYVNQQYYKTMFDAITYLKYQRQSGFGSKEHATDCIGLAMQMVKLLARENDLLATIIGQELTNYIRNAHEVRESIQSVEEEALVDQVQALSLEEREGQNEALQLEIVRRAEMLSDALVEEEVEKKLAEQHQESQEAIQALREEMLKEREDLQKDLESAQRSLKGAEYREEQLREKNQAHHERAMVLQQENKRYREKQEAKDEELASLTRRLSELQVSSEKLVKSNLQLSSKLEELEDLQSELDQSQLELAKHKKQLEGISQEKQVAQEACKSLEERLRRVQAQIKENQALHEKIEQLQGENSSLVEQQEALAREKNELKALVEEARVRVALHVQVAKEAQEKSALYEEHYLQIKREFDNAQILIQSLSKNSEAVTRRFSLANETRVRDLGAQLTALKAKHQNLLKQTQGMFLENMTLRNQAQSHRWEIGSLQGKLHVQSDELIMLKEAKARRFTVNSPFESALFKRDHLQALANGVEGCLTRVQFKLTNPQINVFRLFEQCDALGFLYAGAVRSHILNLPCANQNFVVCGDEKKLCEALKGFESLGNGYYLEPTEAITVQVVGKLDLLDFARKAECLENTMFINSNGILLDPLKALKLVKAQKNLQVIPGLIERLAKEPILAFRVLSLAYKTNRQLDRDTVYWLKRHCGSILKVGLAPFLDAVRLMVQCQNPSVHFHHNIAFMEKFLPTACMPMNDNHWMIMHLFYQQSLDNWQSYKYDSNALLSLLLVTPYCFFLSKHRNNIEDALTAVIKDVLSTFEPKLHREEVKALTKHLVDLIPQWHKRFVDFKEQLAEQARVQQQQSPPVVVFSDVYQHNPDDRSVFIPERDYKGPSDNSGKKKDPAKKL